MGAHRAAYNSFITAPNIKFNDFNPAANEYYNTLSIDDCDQPQAPNTKIIKIGFSSIAIEWTMNEIDINGAKQVLEFQIEYAVLPKKKRKKKKKKRKDTDSDSDSSSDSESESDSDSDSDSDSSTDSDSSSNSDSDSNESDEEEKEVDVEDFDESLIDIDALKWIANEKKFKVKAKSLKRNKFKFVIEELKDEWPHIIRIRGRNESGWGKYCKLIKFQTNKLVIDSKILSNKQKLTLMQWAPKGTKRRWKRICRGTKDGFAAHQFHTKCDGKGPTLIVIKSTIGNIFGGYTELPWASSGSYKRDNNAFVYVLQSKTNKRQKATKWGVKPSNNNSVYHDSGYGWTQGGGHDFYLCNNCNTVNSSYSNLGSSYQAPSDKNMLAGSYNFKVTEFEVFHLVKK